MEGKGKKWRESQKKHKNTFLILINSKGLRNLTIHQMWWFHCAGNGKNKKVKEIFPLLAFWPERAKEWKFNKIIYLVRNGLFQILFLLSVPKILKNCLEIVEEKKVWQKIAILIGIFALFLTPFQASSIKICLQVKSSH